MFNDVVNIQDASFTEDFDDKEPPASSAISAQKIKSLAAGKKAKPPAKAISAQKAKTKSQLAKVEPDEKSPQFVSDDFRIEPSSAVKPAKKARTINDRWLIDAAADELYHTIRVAGKAAGKATKEGFKATRIGVKAINTITGDIIDNPAMKNIAKQHEITMHSIAQNAQRGRDSIIATENNSRKRNMTVGSLITTHTSRTNTGTMATVPRQHVFTHVVHRKGGDIIRYFDSLGLEISATQAKRLIKDEPLINVNAEQYNQNVRGVVNPVGTTQNNPFGTRRKQGNPIGEITRAATASGLIRRAKNPVGVIQGAFQGAYTPVGAVNTATTATNVMKNPTGFVQRNPVVDSSAVTPYRLVYKHAGA